MNLTTLCPRVSADEVESTDEALMQAVQDREGPAFESLYRRHASLLRAVIYRAVHHDADADAVLQEVFIEIWDRAGSYTPQKGRPPGWLMTPARRRRID